MTYETVITVATQILITAALISLVISVFTEFLIKNLFTLTTKSLNYFITISSMVTTFAAAVAYIQIKSIEVHWYTWLAVVFIGFLVACISMNGYDKIFSYIYEWIKGIFNESEVSE